MISNLGLSSKLFALSAITTFFLLLQGAIGIFQMHAFYSEIDHNLRSVKTESDALIATEKAFIQLKMQVQDWKNILLRGNNADSYDQFLDDFNQEETNVQDYLTTAAQLMKKEGVPTDMVDKVRLAHAELGKKYRAALASFDKSDRDSGRKIDAAVKSLDHATDSSLENLAQEIEERLSERIAAQIERSGSRYAFGRNIVAALMAIGFAASVVLSVLIGGSILKQLGGEPALATAISRRIAGGNLVGEVPVRPGADASLLAAMRDMQSGLRGMIGGTLDTAGKVAEAAQALSTSSHQVRTAASRQSDAAASMAASVEEMTVSINHIADNAADAQRSASAAGSLAADGSQVVRGTISEMDKIAGAVTHSSALIGTLGEHSQQISNIVSVIKDIADQTNLLALNAAIEAARAGDQGRGFAVVADEVRKLAERTTQSTQEIAAMIGAIQKGTADAVTGMSQGSARVGEGVQMVGQAGKAMEQIQAGVAGVLSAVEEISSSLREQSTTSNQIATNVEGIAQMTEETSAVIGQVADSADRLQGLAQSLKDSVSSFRI